MRATVRRGITLKASVCRHGRRPREHTVPFSLSYHTHQTHRRSFIRRLRCSVLAQVCAGRTVCGFHFSPVFSSPVLRTTNRSADTRHLNFKNRSSPTEIDTRMCKRKVQREEKKIPGGLLCSSLCIFNLLHPGGCRVVYGRASGTLLLGALK